MITSPWAIGLTFCSIMVVFLLLRVVIPSIILLIRGEEGDSEFQLSVEKKEMLHCAVLWLVWIYVLSSPFLLTAAAFDMGKQIPGAMCPIGTFNANSYGFPFLLARLWGVFFVLVWLVLYSLDIRTTTTPFRKIRRYLIIFIFFWMLSDTLLQTMFFTSIDPGTVTSCCAVVFDPTGSILENPAGILAQWPSKSLFVILSGIYLCIGLSAARSRHSMPRLVFGLLAPIFFFFSVTAVISIISPIVYALPHHHCPFCILTGKEGWVGIPLMFSIYIGSIFGWYAGLWQIAIRSGKISGVRNRKVGVFFIVSFAGFLFFFAESMAVMVLYNIFGEFL